jgi:hypothetical protein
MNQPANNETISLSPTQGSLQNSNNNNAQNMSTVVNNNSPTLNPNTSSSSLVSANSNNVVFSGYLMKWTNYIKGYQKRWFVLNNGLLSYFR